MTIEELRAKFEQETNKKAVVVNQYEYPTEQYFKWMEQQLLKLFAIPDIVGQSKLFVCGHPPKQTYLLNGTWHCEKCGGKWESIANK